MSRTGLLGLWLLLLTTPVCAGPENGAFTRTNTVQGFYTMTYRIYFTPDQPAKVEVEGDGDTPLALIIVDPEGTRVTQDYDNPDNPTVEWTPKKKGLYQVKIVNRGGVPNRFKITMK